MDDDYQRHHSQWLATLLQHLYAAEWGHSRISRHCQLATIANRIVTRHPNRTSLRSHWTQAGDYYQHRLIEFFFFMAGNIQTASAHPHYVGFHGYFQYFSSCEFFPAYFE